MLDAAERYWRRWKEGHMAERNVVLGTEERPGKSALDKPKMVALELTWALKWRAGVCFGAY